MKIAVIVAGIVSAIVAIILACYRQEKERTQA